MLLTCHHHHHHHRHHHHHNHHHHHLLPRPVRPGGAGDVGRVQARPGVRLGAEGHEVEGLEAGDGGEDGDEEDGDCHEDGEEILTENEREVTTVIHTRTLGEGLDE